MPMNIRKMESNNRLVVERIHHAKSYGLAVDRKLCVGCELCSLVCPREAIVVNKQQKKEGQKAQRAMIDIDKDKCHYCGICAAICPYGAVEVSIDGQALASVVEKESFPQLIRGIAIDTSECPKDCNDCEKECPLGIIKVKSNPATGDITVNVDEEKCPCCRVCEIKCPVGAIHARNIFTGKLKINQEKCPSDCRDCVDVCPITGALYVSEQDNKVHVNQLFCTYCGACRITCPQEGAIELSRSTINHTPVRSGAWNRALEKLTSTVEMAKELRGKGRRRAMDAVKNRLEPRKN